MLPSSHKQSHCKLRKGFISCCAPLLHQPRHKIKRPQDSITAENIGKTGMRMKSSGPVPGLRKLKGFVVYFCFLLGISVYIPLKSAVQGICFPGIIPEWEVTKKKSGSQKWKNCRSQKWKNYWIPSSSRNRVSL